MKYNNVNIDVNQETKAILDMERKERTGFIFSFIITISYFCAFSIIPPTIFTICFPSDKKGKTFTVVFVINFIVFLFSNFLLFSIARYQSKRRFKYLPLDKGTMQKLDIYTADDYCSFLNEFLFVTPFGRRAKENSPVSAIAELPKNILNEINSNFSVKEGVIYWNEHKSAYTIYKY